MVLFVDLLVKLVECDVVFGKGIYFSILYVVGMLVDISEKCVFFFL